MRGQADNIQSKRICEHAGERKEYVEKNGDTSILQGLFDLISNVILLEEEHSNRQKFHFRIGMERYFFVHSSNIIRISN